MLLLDVDGFLLVGFVWIDGLVYYWFHWVGVVLLVFGLRWYDFLLALFVLLWFLFARWLGLLLLVSCFGRLVL